MGKIKVLDISVSNKIAAGEVVERPASVVKELLENALDAGASQIVIEIKNGGISYIRVADNGCGIARDEVPVAILRHATSKISEAEDLDAIRTLGFRGEALSSIAAVSTMEIFTRTPSEETGTHLVSENGSVVECAEAGCPKGTTVVVRDLFMNTPARMKFLKKNFTEAGYISDIVNRLALARADVSFRLLSDGKEVLFTAGGSDLLGCIYAIYGKDLKNTMRPADYAENGVSVHGFCATGAGSRPNRSMQSFFVNGRYIKSPLLARAVEEAYKNEVMGGKFPACVLLLEVSPSMVDINVHPTKLEAKFADEKAVYHSVYWAAKNALYQKNEIPALTLQAEEETPVVSFTQKKPVFAETKPARRPVMMQEETRASSEKKETSFVWAGLSRAMEKKQEPAMHEQTVFSQTMAEAEKQTTKSVHTLAEPATEQTPVMPTPEVHHEEPLQEEKPAFENKKVPDYRICGTIFNTYIIVEQNDQILLVDQHAAHERLRYEALLKQFEGQAVQSQMLLIPVTVRLTATEDALFQEYRETLTAMGFEVEPFGEKTVILRGAPEDLDEASLRSLFIEVLGHLGEKRQDARSEKAQRALYTIACKSAVRAGHHLKEEEMKTLLDAVFALDSINTCPHGRPITVAMTRGFIEKQFKRIV
ncbi:MAG: DNA mismatch repair endonuclease MutL [Ruminococcaceae bacterium]|nr:DNA mismatch repair endonuclease MutL [Oscillospiraceae bacterium]